MTASLSVSAARARVKHPGESILFGVDFSRLLAAGELLTSVVSVDAAPAGLALSGLAVNGAPFDDDEGGTVATGNGAQFRVAGGVSGTDYSLTVTVTTSAANTRIVVCPLQVRDR